MAHMLDISLDQVQTFNVVSKKHDVFESFHQPVIIFRANIGTYMLQNKMFQTIHHPKTIWKPHFLIFAKQFPKPPRALKTTRDSSTSDLFNSKRQHWH